MTFDHAADMKRRLARARAAMLAAMGGKCARCGFADERALQVDHVHGSGLRELKGRSGGPHTYYTKVLASVLADEGKYQLLCANCNWIKRAERREVGAYAKPQ